MRLIIAFFFFVLFTENIAHTQTVTLKQIGKETVMFSTRYIEWSNHYLYTIENTGALYKTDLATGVQTRLENVVYRNTRRLIWG